MNDLILVTVEGGFALCRVITTLTPEQAKGLGQSMVYATTPTPKKKTTKSKGKAS